jgi:hypothetical protein
MNGLQSPEALTDLYRDLRDRPVLPLLLVVLVAGIAIVPIALSSKSTTQPVAPPPPAVTVAKKSDVPAGQVKVSDPGVRVYQQRLSGDSPKNPFTGGPANPSSIASSTSTSTPSSATSSSGSTATTTGSTATTGSTTPSTTPTGGTTQVQTTTENKFFFYRVKVKTGPVGGKMTVHDNVKAVTSLPTKQVPAAAFIGVTTNNNFQAQSAVFLVNSGVSLVSGTGSCALTGTQCQLLSLKPGDHADLTWTDGVSYRLTLLKFNLIERNKLPSSQNGKGQGGGGSGDSGPTGRTEGGWQGPGSHNFTF